MVCMYTHWCTSQKVSKGDGVWDAGTLMFRVHGTHEGEGQVEDVAVDQTILTPE